MIKWGYIILIFAALLVAEACKNNDEVFPNVTYSFFNVVNATPDTLNFYLNGTRQNNASSLYPGSYSGYSAIPSGSEDVQFKKSGGFSVLFSVPVKLQDSINYSLYLTGASSSGTFIGIDTLDTTGFGSAYLYYKIRFVNASPNTGNVDVYIGDSVNFKSRAFKTTSVFVLAGAGTKTVEIFPAGSATTTTPLLDTSITFNGSNFYTLFTRGQLNGKGGSALSLGVALNPYD